MIVRGWYPLKNEVVLPPHCSFRRGTWSILSFFWNQKFPRMMGKTLSKRGELLSIFFLSLSEALELMQNLHPCLQSFRRWSVMHILLLAKSLSAAAAGGRQTPKKTQAPTTTQSRASSPQAKSTNPRWWWKLSVPKSYVTQKTFRFLIRNQDLAGESFR